MARVLITGGSGFLGRRLGLRLRTLGHEVALAARNNKQNFLASEFSGCPSLAMDVTSIESIRDALVQVDPEVVIHAAATKFVDVSEVQPFETIDVNVLGSENVARACLGSKVKVVIGVSTDKAAPPVRNTYGLSKALMERMFCSLDGRGETRFLCVRYGNVAWSTASVFTQWRKHIKATGVVETTGPEMFRFIFTVDEAVQLVVTALDRADRLGGQVLSRAMKSAQIKDVLNLWCSQEGATYRNIGARLGERPDEILIGEPELPYTTTFEVDGIEHYAVSFKRLAEKGKASVLSASNAERLTDAEILQILNNPPQDEA